jgi:hypothetical protein
MVARGVGDEQFGKFQQLRFDIGSACHVNGNDVVQQRSANHANTIF